MCCQDFFFPQSSSGLACFAKSWNPQCLISRSNKITSTSPGTLLPLAKCRQLKELVVSLPAQSTFSYLEHESGCLLQAIKPYFQVCLFKHPESCDLLLWANPRLVSKGKTFDLEKLFFTKSVGKLSESFPVITRSCTTKLGKKGLFNCFLAPLFF